MDGIEILMFSLFIGFICLQAEIFCPNGTSSNVSPMMENKCGDRLATPSVSVCILEMVSSFC